MASLFTNALILLVVLTATRWLRPIHAASRKSVRGVELEHEHGNQKPEDEDDHHHLHHLHHGDGSCGVGTDEDWRAFEESELYEGTSDHNGRHLGRITLENSEPIRVLMLYDHFSEDPAYMCTTLGQTVDPCKSRYAATSSPCPMECTEEDIATPEKIAIATKRMEWAKAHVAKLLRVQPRSSGVDFSTSTTGAAANAYLKLYFPNYVDALADASMNQPDADIIVVATLRKHNSDNVAGYADCMYRNGWGRCILGYFNFCPKTLDVSNTNNPLTIELERRTALHEL